MIYAYGVTRIGPYHVKNATVCQDAHYIMKLSDNCVICAVADGLGSEKHSDIASKTATQTAVKYCAEHYSENMDSSAILRLLKQSFRVSQCFIGDIAAKNGHDLSEYDTTLDLVLYSFGKVYYGHVGDSGVIVQTDNGLFLPVTHQDRDDFGRVFPLIFEDHWQFGVVEHTVASVMLCTDGILDILFPVLLKNQPVTIYVALAQFLMDKDRLGFETTSENDVSDAMTAYIDALPENQVSDDKTVVVLCDVEIEVSPQPSEYYQVPDFTKLEKEFRDKYMREAYPHLFRNINTEDCMENQISKSGDKAEEE